MNQNAQHRNKCQACFKQTGKFILDCYCFLCMQCFSKQRARNSNICAICSKSTHGKFIDTRDQNSMNKLDYLFGNIDSLLNKCINVYKFQNQIDLRYCKYLENQLSKYKELLNHIIKENPRLSDYVNKFFKRKATPHKSVSERVPVSKQHLQEKVQRNHSLSPSPSNSSIQAQHQRFVDAQRVNQGEKNYSANIGYKIPNINYNTALRSSKRPHSGSNQEDFDYYNS